MASGTPKISTEGEWITATEESGSSRPALLSPDRKPRYPIRFAAECSERPAQPPESSEYAAGTSSAENDSAYETEASDLTTCSAPETTDTIPELNPAGSILYITGIPPSIPPEQDNSCPPAQELMLRIKLADAYTNSTKLYSAAKLAKEAEMPRLAKEMYRNAIRLSVNEGNIDKAREMAKEAGLENLIDELLKK
jgi:hypothetical protein